MRLDSDHTKSDFRNHPDSRLKPKEPEEVGEDVVSRPRAIVTFKYGGFNYLQLMRGSPFRSL